MYTARQVIHNALGEGLIDQYAHDYAEPGYSLGEGKIGILFADWNDPSHWGQSVITSKIMSRLVRVAERAGFEIEWCDEWSTCKECGKAYRITADSYCWKPSHDTNGICIECIDPVDYLHNLENNPTTCNTLDHINPLDHDYILAKEDMANGWYGGQNDDPKVVAKSLRSLGITRFLFSLTDIGQFDSHFSVYVHIDEAGLLGDQEPDSKLPYDPAIEMGKALRGELTKHDTLETRTTTPEEL